LKNTGAVPGEDVKPSGTIGLIYVTFVDGYLLRLPACFYSGGRGMADNWRRYKHV